MAIKIAVSDTVKFEVKGFFTDEAGAKQAFGFHLVATRLPQDELRTRLQPGSAETTTEFMGSVVKDWAGVLDDANNKVPFSAEALQQLFRLPGLASLCFEAYTAEAGARAKN
jgi:hypothetical protein